jgi:two-component system NtrC family sensor kinase
MSAVGQLISGVAHELNNPLTAILGYSQLLADNGEVTPRGAAYVDRLHRQAQRTHRIVQNLLSFARQHKPERTAVELNRVLDDTLLLREYDLRLNNIEIHRSFDAALPLVYGDPHQLQQVFLNILNNAVDAILETGPGGQVRVRTWSEGGRVLAEIADSGPGVADPARVFDPFYTTKPVGKGTGLGLSICYGLVQEHGGHIGVRNIEPRGAALCISLPPAPQELDRPCTAGAPRALPAASARILLVDDEESVLDLEQEVLRGHCRWARPVRTGREAIAFLEQHEVDLVVTDLKMPGDVSGKALYQWICAHRPGLASRVIFTMSDSGDENVAALLARTGCPHLQKPFQLQQFLETVQRVLAVSCALP